MTQHAPRNLVPLWPIYSCGWGWWLCAQETFALKWDDLTVIEPQDGPSVELPLGMGAILALLLPDTKSSQTITADVVMAYTTASGLSLGKWLHRLRAALGLASIPVSDDFLFVHADGSPWTSKYYRTTYLYPFLHMQRLADDLHLKPFDGVGAHQSLEEVFYSLHSYRRGGRSEVSKARPVPLRRATDDEVNEHGRWRVKRSNMKMAQLYLSWDLVERVAITAHCM